MCLFSLPQRETQSYSISARVSVNYPLPGVHVHPLLLRDGKQMRLNIKQSLWISRMNCGVIFQKRGGVSWSSVRRIRSDVAISNQRQIKVKLCKINVVMVSTGTDTKKQISSVFLYHETCMMRRRLCTTTNPQY